MADDVNANIRIGVDTSDAISSIKNLQREIARLNADLASGSQKKAKEAIDFNRGLVDTVNATGKFSASMTNVKSSTEAFTTALEKNKLSMGQYFKYAAASTKTFGRQSSVEFQTITKVATERVKELQAQYISMGRDANGVLKAIKIKPLALDMQDLSTKTMIAAQKHQLFNQLVKQGSTQMLNWGKNTQWAGRQLMVGFTIPLTMFATAAGKSFMEIEKQIIKIQRVYGDFNTTVEETKAMTDQIRSLASEYTKYGVAVADTLNLAADAAAAGKTGQELLSQISEATRLAVLGNVEQTQALETTMSIANAFGTAADELAGKIDFLNAVENQSVTSIEDLTEAIPKAGPVIQQLGGDVEDLAFFLTAMKEGGINASEGANALKSGLASLINPTGKAKEMLAGFGINIEKIVNSNKGDVKGIVIDFAKALDELDPLNRAQAIEQLFGKFQFSRLSTLFQNVIKDGSQAQRVLELTNATTQELAILSKRELGKIEQTTTYKFEKAFADFQAALAPVGEAFLKFITPVIEFGTKLLEQFNNMDAGIKQFAITVAVILGGVFPALLMTVGLFANGIANIFKIVAALGSRFKTTSMDASILGNQLQYMTQTEIQAAASAASLDQVHSKLHQTFTAERAAVDALTAAYRRHIAAQNGKITGSGGRSKPAKYASGVVSVPGPKGAGDVVPAMLSPGESVIPAEMTKKYAPLIRGMVAGNIPGFADGVFNVFSNATGFLSQRTNKQLTAEGPGSGVDAKALAAEIKSVGGGKGAFASPIVRQIVTEMGLATTEKDIQKLMSGPQGKEIRTLAQNITGGIAGAVVQQGGRISDSDLARISQREVKKAAAGTRFAGAAQRVMSRRTSFAQEGVGNRKSLIANMPWYGAGATQRKRDVAMGAGITGNAGFSDAGLARAHLTEMKKMTSSEIREYIAKNKLTPSPSLLRLIDAKESKEAKTSAGKIKSDARNSSTVSQAEQRRLDKNARARERYAERKAAAQPAPKKPGIGSRIASGIKGMGGMGLGMGVSMAGGAMAMVPGLEGLGTALGLVGPLFMMLPAPVAAVAAGLAGMVGIIMSVNAAKEAEIKRSVEMANALSASTSEVNAIAEELGTVSISEQVAQQRELVVGTSQEQLSAGQQFFRETDAGKEITASILSALNSGVSDQRLIQAIRNKMGYAVAQGVMDPTTAQDYAAALAVEIGRQDISVKVKAEIESLVGPNGENLLENPFAVTSEIVSSGLDSAKSKFSGTELGGRAEGVTYRDPAKMKEGVKETINAYSVAVAQADIIAVTFDEKIKQHSDNLKNLKVGTAEYTAELDLLKQAQADRTAQLDQAQQQELEVLATLKEQRDMLGDDEAFNKVLNISVTDAYGEEAKPVLDKIEALGDDEMEISIKMALTSGSMNLATANALLEAGANGKTLRAQYNLYVNTLGMGAAARAVIALNNALNSIRSGTPVSVNQLENLGKYSGPTGVSPDSGGNNNDKTGNDTPGGGGGGGTPEDAKLAKWNKQKDKIQKALNVVALREEAINKKYDERKKRLEEIAKLNQKIADGQKTQLTIAEALSSGDISAAARAVQDAKDKAAQYAQEQQMAALEAKRQAELDGIIVNGKTKEAYEAEIARLNLKIAERELALALKNTSGSGGGSGGGSGNGSGSSSSSSSNNSNTTNNTTTNTTTSTNNSGWRYNSSANPNNYENAGYGKYWKWAGGKWTATVRPKPDVRSGYLLSWDDKNDKWIPYADPRTPSGTSSGAGSSSSGGSGTGIGGRYAVAFGGIIPKRLAFGGVANYLASGGKSLGSDTIPAMLTPGEFVVKRPAVQGFGVKNLEAINNGNAAALGSVYNYSVTVNAATNSNADDIARAVMSKIKQVEGQKLRGNSY